MTYVFHHMCVITHISNMSVSAIEPYVFRDDVCFPSYVRNHTCLKLQVITHISNMSLSAKGPYIFEIYDSLSAKEPSIFEIYDLREKSWAACCTTEPHN